MAPPSALPVPAGLLLMLAGVGAATAVARAGALRQGLPVRRAVDGLFLMIVAGLLVGHVADLVLYDPGALRGGWRALLPWSGGVCALGAVAGAAAAGALWFRRAPGGLLPHADNLVTALSLGWAIGRVGCFIDHDHLGRLTDAALAVAMPGGRRHDLGLYEAGLALLIFVVLVALRDPAPGGGRHAPRPPGRALAVAALMFGIGRFAIERLRADDLELLGRRSDPRFHGWTLVQYATVVLVACGAWLWRSGATTSGRPASP
jgi:phosphatidylglycerol:prolipoprotein diacylglycerol transferase